MKKLILIAVALAAQGCAALKSGWVKTEFVDGQMTEYMICRMHIDGEGDIVAQCRDLDRVAQEIRNQQKRQQRGTDQL